MSGDRIPDNAKTAKINAFYLVCFARYFGKLLLKSFFPYASCTHLSANFWTCFLLVKPGAEEAMSVPAFPNESTPATPGEGTTPDGLESVGADVGGGGGGGVTDEEAAEEAVTFEVMASVRRHLTSSAVARSSGVCPSWFSTNLVTQSILFCWLFTIHKSVKKVCSLLAHNHGLHRLFLMVS